jgi:DNA-directed RNA polymerase subunit RPC12/RpoP
MIELKAAKCPQCNADIEVNTNLEKAICQYCGCTILIEDVVPKIKVEHSGTIRIEGQKDRTYHLKQALQHIKVKEYNKALSHLREIVLNDEFDIEAYSYIIISNLSIMKENDYNIPFFLKNKNIFPDEVKVINEFYDTVNRLSLIDNNNSRSMYLGKYSNDIDKYVSIIEKKVSKKNYNIIYFSKVTISIIIFSLVLIALSFCQFNLQIAGGNPLMNVMFLIADLLCIWFLHKVLDVREIICFMVGSLIVDCLLIFNPSYVFDLLFNYPLYFFENIVICFFISLLAYLLTNGIINQELFIRSNNVVSKILRVLLLSTSIYCIYIIVVFMDGFTFRKIFLVGVVLGVIISLIFKKMGFNKKTN